MLDAYYCFGALKNAFPRYGYSSLDTTNIENPIFPSYLDDIYPRPFEKIMSDHSPFITVQITLFFSNPFWINRHLAVRACSFSLRRWARVDHYNSFNDLDHSILAKYPNAYLEKVLPLRTVVMRWVLSASLAVR